MHSATITARHWHRFTWVHRIVSGLLWVAGTVQASNDPTRFSLEQLMSLNVVGASKYAQTQSEVPAAVSVVTREEIQAFGWRTLGQALASLPGIYTTYDRQYHYLGARGFGLPGDYNTRMLLTINGNRVNDPVYDQAPIGKDFPLDLDLVERIEFIPGPGGAVYGPNAMFGVINVITRKGVDMQGGEVQLSWQTRRRAQGASVSVGRQLADGTDFVLALSGSDAAGQDLPMTFGASGIAGVANGMDAERFHRLFAQLAKDRWTFDLIHSQRIKDDPTGSYFSDPLVPGQFSGDEYSLADAQYQDSFRAGTLQLTGRLFSGRYRFSSMSSYGTSIEMPAQGDWRGAELRLLSTAVAHHKQMIGLDYQDNVRVDQQLLDLAHPVNSVTIAHSRRRTGLYLQDEWHISDQLDATLGVRWDTHGSASTKGTPRIGLIWQVQPGKSTLKAMYGRANRNPNAFERDFSDGVSQAANPSLRGENIETSELVFDHRLDQQTHLRASAYHWHMDQLIVLGTDPASGLTQYQSGPDVDVRGVELSADRTWPDGSRVRGSWSVQRAAFANSDSVPNSPKRLFKLLLSKPLPGIGVNVAYELHGESERLTLDGSRVGGYGVSSLYLRWKTPATGWSYGLGLANLFDKHYAQPAADTNWQNALAQDGRSWHLLASYRF